MIAIIIINHNNNPQNVNNPTIPNINQNCPELNAI